MKKISLTEIEISHLRDVYEAELEAAKKRIATLTGVLSKLGELKQTHEQIVSKLLEGGNVIIKKTEKKVAKKPGRRGRPPKAIMQVTVTDEPKKIVKPTKVKVAAKTKAAKPKVTKVTKPVAVKPKVTKATKPVAAKPKPVKSTTKKVEIAKPKTEKKPAKVVAEKVVKVAAKKVTPNKKVKAKVKKGKVAPKTNWGGVLVDAVKTFNTFKPSSEIVKAAIDKLNLPPEEQKKASSSLATALTKLHKTDKKLSAIKNEKARGNLYGLPEWLTVTGEVIPEMKDKN